MIPFRIKRTCFVTHQFAIAKSITFSCFSFPWNIKNIVPYPLIFPSHRLHASSFVWWLKWYASPTSCWYKCYRRYDSNILTMYCTLIDCKNSIHLRLRADANDIWITFVMYSPSVVHIRIYCSLPRELLTDNPTFNNLLSHFW